MVRRLAVVPDTPRRVVAYVRVSALMGRAGNDFHSPDVQLGAIRRVIAGLTEVAVIEDIDVTGRHFSREGIDRIRGMAERRQIDALAVYDVSRLGRNVRESLAFLAELADLGVTILSACEQVDTSTPAGRLMLTNMLAIAEYRSDEIGRGWSATIARRAERGEHHGRPLGYVRQDRRLVPDSILGPVITEAFGRYASGVPISEICRYLSAIRGKATIAANVKKVLRNPVYLGKVTAGGELLPGLHQPLVDEQTWARVQDRLAAEAGMPPRHLAPTWSLVGLAECPQGHKLQRQPHRHRHTDELVDRLVCGMARGGVAGGCDGIGRPRLDRVEAEVLRQVREYVHDLTTDHTACARALANSRAADRAALQRELVKIRTGMTRATRAWSVGDVPDNIYRATMGDLRRTESHIAAELAQLPDESGEPVEAANAAKALLELWPRMSYAEQGRTLRSVVQKVVVRASCSWREHEANRVDVRFHW